MTEKILGIPPLKEVEVERALPAFDAALAKAKEHPHYQQIFLKVIPKQGYRADGSIETMLSLLNNAVSYRTKQEDIRNGIQNASLRNADGSLPDNLDEVHSGLYETLYVIAEDPSGLKHGLTLDAEVFVRLVAFLDVIKSGIDVTSYTFVRKNVEYLETQLAKAYVIYKSTQDALISEMIPTIEDGNNRFKRVLAQKLESEDPLKLSEEDIAQLTAAVLEDILDDANAGLVHVPEVKEREKSDLETWLDSVVEEWGEKNCEISACSVRYNKHTNGLTLHIGGGRVLGDDLKVFEGEKLSAGDMYVIVKNQSNSDQVIRKIQTPTDLDTKYLITGIYDIRIHENDEKKQGQSPVVGYMATKRGYYYGENHIPDAKWAQIIGRDPVPGDDLKVIAVQEAGKNNGVQFVLPVKYNIDYVRQEQEFEELRLEYLAQQKRLLIYESSSMGGSAFIDTSIKTNEPNDSRIFFDGADEYLRGLGIYSIEAQKNRPTSGIHSGSKLVVMEEEIYQEMLQERRNYKENDTTRNNLLKLDVKEQREQTQERYERILTYTAIAIINSDMGTNLTEAEVKQILLPEKQDFNISELEQMMSAGVLISTFRASLEARQ